MQPLRKSGYQHFIDPRTKKESFILRTGPEFYPRFHLYLNYRGANIEFDLHLDQKKPQYKGAKAHNAEYDGPTVEKELMRIRGWIANEFQVLPLNSSNISNESNNKNESLNKISEQNDKPVESNKKNDDLFGGIF